jgi:hypothetical protein
MNLINTSTKEKYKTFPTLNFRPPQHDAIDCRLAIIENKLQSLMIDPVKKCVVYYIDNEGKDYYLITYSRSLCDTLLSSDPHKVSGTFHVA